MPQIKQSAKRLRQSQKRGEQNQKKKAHIEYLIRRFKKTIQDKDKDKAKEYSDKLIKSIDKVAKKNIYHPNKASRLKSKITKQVNSIKK